MSSEGGVTGVVPLFEMDAGLGKLLLRCSTTYLHVGVHRHDNVERKRLKN